MTGVEPSNYGNELEPTAYEHVTSYNNFYESGTSRNEPAHAAKDFTTRPWHVSVSGDVEAWTIDIEDILSSFTQEERDIPHSLRGSMVHGGALGGLSAERIAQAFPTDRQRQVRGI